MTTVTVTAPVAGGTAGTGSGATVEAMPAAEDLTPRGNAVGTVGEPLTSGCVGQVCDLTVTVTGIEVNPADCDVYGDGRSPRDVDTSSYAAVASVTDCCSKAIGQI
ncbi:hypothetical protein D092_20590 [Rhodococcus ruber Chol-4]|nr:hypothetical protein D092_20590 [Rhodococcus ruber Chol-4]